MIRIPMEIVRTEYRCEEECMFLIRGTCTIFSKVFGAAIKLRPAPCGGYSTCHDCDTIYRAYTGDNAPPPF